MSKNTRKVMRYLKRPITLTDPLVFCKRGEGYNGWEVDPELFIHSMNELPDNPETLAELIYAILLCSSKNISVNAHTNRRETIPNRARSVLDIWRHVIFFKPRTSIFRVMRTMYKIQEELGGHFCNDVRRRVFKLRLVQPNWDLITRSPDEFGLYFCEWSNIGTKTDNS